MLLAYLIYAGLRHQLDPLYTSWFAGLTLALHELGHLIFMPLGSTLGLLGGSIMQLLAPLAAAIYLWRRQHDYFGLAVGGCWLSYSTWELATYIGDASREQLPLVGFGGNPQHDWAVLLTRWHLLNHDSTIAFLVRACALLTWAAAVTFAGWLCYRIRRSASPQSRR